MSFAAASFPLLGTAAEMPGTPGVPLVLPGRPVCRRGSILSSVASEDAAGLSSQSLARRREAVVEEFASDSREGMSDEGRTERAGFGLKNVDLLAPSVHFAGEQRPPFRPTCLKLNWGLCAW
jgi:hypothetical protein